MIEERVNELEGLIDEDAAALLVAKELGVPLPQQLTAASGVGRPLLKDLLPGLQNVQIAARVLRVSSWKGDDNRAMTRLTVADESACIECIAWGENAERIAKSIRPGDCILIARASVVRYRGRLEVKITDETRLERIDEPSIPPFDELCRIHRVNVVRLHVHEVVSSGKGILAYGVDSEGLACVLIPTGLEAPPLQRGDVILVQDPKILAGNARRYRMTRASRLFLIENLLVTKSQFRIAEVDEEGVHPNAIGLRGHYVAAIPSKFRGGFLVVLSGQRSATSVLTFDEGLAADLRSIRPGALVELIGLYATQRGYRLNPFHNLIVLAHEKPSSYSENFSPGGYVKSRATVVSASFKLRTLSSGEPFVGAVMILDDGVGRARVLTSYFDHLSSLLSASWEEVRELASLGALSHLLAYAEEELRGAEVEVEGYLSGDGVLALTDIKVS